MTQSIAHKKCTGCEKPKALFEFDKNTKTKDGYRERCRMCQTIQRNAYLHTRDGVIGVIYSEQVRSSKRRGHLAPNYTLKKFKEWIYRQVNFDCLYLNWINSGYNKWKKPSCDRKDDYKPYILDNLLRVCTWQENCDRGYADRKAGINNKNSKAVIQITKNGGVMAKFHSQKEASRATKIPSQNISACCSGARKIAGGYRWSYSNEVT